MYRFVEQVTNGFIQIPRTNQTLRWVYEHYWDITPPRFRGWIVQTM